MLAMETPIVLIKSPRPHPRMRVINDKISWCFYNELYHDNNKKLMAYENGIEGFGEKRERERLLAENR